jgi:L-iditol 2-dehydrogenase
MKHMKAAMFYGPGDLRLESTPIPDIGDEDILVRIGTSTTCGTDVKSYVRGYRNTKLPMLFGHEFAGEIAAMGDEVTNVRPDLKVGSRVVCANSAPCFRCDYCRKGKFSLCENIKLLWGAFAEYIRVPSAIVKVNTYVLPDDLAYKDACLMEPLACVVHGIEESNVSLGDTLVINGAGPIGLFFVALAKLKGARIISTDLSEERLEVARTLGAHETVNVSNSVDVVKAVKDLTDGKGADVVVEATGLAPVWEQSVEMARKGGTVNLFGGPKTGSVFTVDTNRLHYDMLTLKAVYHHTPYYIEKALNLIKRRQITSDIFVSKDYLLDEVVAAMEAHKHQQVVKAALFPY